MEHSSSFDNSMNTAPLLVAVCEQPMRIWRCSIRAFHKCLKIVIWVRSKVSEEGTLNFFSPPFELSMEKGNVLKALFLSSLLVFNSRSVF